MEALGRDQRGDQRIHQSLKPESAPDRGPQQLGIALGHLGMTDAGINEYEVALEENPRHADAHNNFGVALAMRGQLDRRDRSVSSRHSVPGKLLQRPQRLGNALAMKGDLPGAIREYEYCLKNDPKDPQAHNNFGNALLQEGKLDEAAAQYRIALKLGPRILRRI